VLFRSPEALMDREIIAFLLSRFWKTGSKPAPPWGAVGHGVHFATLYLALCNTVKRETEVKQVLFDVLYKGE